MSEHRSFLKPIHWFRGLAIVFIFLTHQFQFPEWTPFLFPFVQNSTLFFVFISGFLFHYLADDYHFIPYMKKKLSHVGLPYLIAALPGLIYVALMDWRTFDLFYWTQSIFTGQGHHNDPHWYIPMVFIFFLTTPFWKYILNKSALFWLLPVTLFISLFTFRAPVQNQPWLLFIHFAGIFQLGMVVSRTRDWWEKYAGVLSLVLLPLFIWVTSLAYQELALNPQYNRFEEITGGWWRVNIMQIQKLIFSLWLYSALTFLGRYVKKIPPLEALGHVSFGIYFWHYYLILLWQTYLPQWSATLSIQGYLTSTLVILTTLTLIFLLLRSKAKKLSRKIFGL